VADTVQFLDGPAGVRADGELSDEDGSGEPRDDDALAAAGTPEADLVF
jgi:hypothetical protein